MASPGSSTILGLAGVGIIAWDGYRCQALGQHSGPGFGLLLGVGLHGDPCDGPKVATSLAIGSLSSAFIALAFFGVSCHHSLLSGAMGLPAWSWLALNGLVAIPLATLLLARGPRVLPTADVSMFFMLETVLTPVWVWMLFGEMPRPAVLFGGVDR